MIAHFTENIYDIGIALSVSGGDPAPLVGHNAFLRYDIGPVFLTKSSLKN